MNFTWLVLTAHSLTQSHRVLLPQAPPTCLGKGTEAEASKTLG